MFLTKWMHAPPAVRDAELRRLAFRHQVRYTYLPGIVGLPVDQQLVRRVHADIIRRLKRTEPFKPPGYGHHGAANVPAAGEGGAKLGRQWSGMTPSSWTSLGHPSASSRLAKAAVSRSDSLASGQGSPTSVSGASDVDSVPKIGSVGSLTGSFKTYRSAKSTTSGSVADGAAAARSKWIGGGAALEQKQDFFELTWWFVLRKLYGPFSFGRIPSPLD